jgi:hypothetical protein
MKLNAFIKTMIMAVIGFVIMTVKEMEAFNLLYVALTTGFFSIGYFLKNWLFPSLSDKGKIDLRDFLSGLWVAITMGTADILSQTLAMGTIDWKALGWAMLGATLGYFGKTLPQKRE